MNELGAPDKDDGEQDIDPGGHSLHAEPEYRQLARLRAKSVSQRSIQKGQMNLPRLN